jgi:hypothetical protein
MGIDIDEVDEVDDAPPGGAEDLLAFLLDEQPVAMTAVAVTAIPIVSTDLRMAEPSFLTG